MTARVDAPEVSTRLFGGTLVIDGSGFYPGLELINLVVGAQSGPLPTSEQVHVARVGHDFSRRLIRDGGLDLESRRSVIFDDHSEASIAKLFRCLELPTPNVVQAKSWQRTHFFPYSRSLVHWDARLRGGKTQAVSMERIYLRGGGAYAFSVLRHDPDKARRAAIIDGFNDLYPPIDQSPLDRVASVLRDKGASDKSPVDDLVEQKSIVTEDKITNLYRDGVRNILSYRDLPSVDRVRALMNWTGIWLVLLQSSRSALRLNEGDFAAAFIVDCAGTHPQLRRASQRSLKDRVAAIGAAADSVAMEISDEGLGNRVNQIKGFFASTASTCGLLNSNKGRRHFTLKIDAIESLVMASIAQGDELEYERFVQECIFESCGLIVGRSAAEAAGLLNQFDASIFEENERELAEITRAAGMLRVYSDATKMVAVGGAL